MRWCGLFSILFYFVYYNFYLKLFYLLPQNYQKSSVGHIPFTVQYNNGFNFHAVSFIVLTDVILKRNAFCRASIKVLQMICVTVYFIKYNEHRNKTDFRSTIYGKTEWHYLCVLWLTRFSGSFISIKGRNACIYFNLCVWPQSKLLTCATSVPSLGFIYPSKRKESLRIVTQFRLKDSGVTSDKQHPSPRATDVLVSKWTLSSTTNICSYSSTC